MCVSLPNNWICIAISWQYLTNNNHSDQLTFVFSRPPVVPPPNTEKGKSTLLTDFFLKPITTMHCAAFAASVWVYTQAKDCIAENHQRVSHLSKSHATLGSQLIQSRLTLSFIYVARTIGLQIYTQVIVLTDTCWCESHEGAGVVVLVLSQFKRLIRHKSGLNLACGCP